MKLRPIAAILGLGLVTGCTAGNGALEPPYSSAPVSADKLQLAVGVATFTDGSTGLNVVATFRQNNGLSATLLNTPTLTGPFTVPAGAIGTTSAAPTAGTGNFALTTCTPNVDAGTNHVTGSPQALPGTTAVCSTFGQGGGVFSYGFAPENSTTAATPIYTLYGDFLTLTAGTSACAGTQPYPYGGPFFASPCLYGGQIADGGGDLNGIGNGYNAFRGGPPAYPDVRTGTYPSGFIGYTLGYTTFAMAPVAGQYNLSVNVPSGNTAAINVTAPAATLTNTAGLPPFAASPAFAEDGAGGGTATCTAPAGVTETIVELFDESTDAYYTTVVQGGGAVTAKFADALGPSATGSTTPLATLNSGDVYEVTCIGADYPLFEAGPPQNTSATPTITGAGGQADITFAPPLDAAYGAAAGTAIHRRTNLRFNTRATAI